MMNRFPRVVAKAASAGLLVLAATACKDVLVADNLSSPDVDRVFATPAAIEQTIGTGFQACHNALTNTARMPEVLSLGLESYSQLNNFNMGPRVTIPRNPILNQLGSPSVFDEYSSLSRASRLAANALNALNALIEDDPTPGDGILGSPAQDLRAQAFAHFAIGCNSGWLAMIYDSASVIVPGMPADEIPGLSGYTDVMTSALAMFDSAIVIADRSTNAEGSASTNFPTPGPWLGGTPYSRLDFQRIVRSYRARFRAGVARDPAERNAVDWAKVTADAEAGIQQNLRVNSGGSTGWNVGFVGSNMFQDGRAWSQISLMYWGMADVSGSYDAWLATPLLSQKPQFVVVTPDKRWPQGTTRAQQVTASVRPPGNNYDHRPYIAALAADETGDAWGWSYYQFNRNAAIRFNSPSNTGDWPHMMKAEIDMLAAEGHIRAGNIPAAAAKIDITRVGKGELPPLTGVITTADQPVPGGASCVPRVPDPAAQFKATKCGNIMEAMKYEKRMETAYTSFGRWWIDGRGWGDLIEGTATQYPVPYQDINARYPGRASYPLGGSGGNSAAARGTYGF
jgi:hypothetical protein